MNNSERIPLPPLPPDGGDYKLFHLACGLDRGTLLLGKRDGPPARPVICPKCRGTAYLVVSPRQRRLF
jgi:hypothetical protein